MNYTVLPPAYTLADKEYIIPEIRSNEFSDSHFTVCQSSTNISDGFIRLSRTWTNISSLPVSFQCALYVKSDFSYTHYLIPSVSYNGNNFGTDNEPKGLAHNGSPWVFSYERTSIPSCTISENENTFLSVFASDDSQSSLVSSCSLIENIGNTLTHAIRYPNIERPLSYTAKNAYTPAYEPQLTLLPGESVTFNAYILSGKPYSKNFAAANVQNAALTVLKHEHTLPDNLSKIKEASFSFLHILLTDINNVKLPSIGLSADENNSFRVNRHFEIGWCGQNAMFARLMLAEYKESNKPELLSNAIEILDTWLNAFYDNGLMSVSYEKIGSDNNIADTCNLGYAAAEYVRSYRIAKELGVDKPKWLAAAVGIAGFMVNRYSPEYGFGKAYNVSNAELIDTKGTVGAFIIPALLEVYKETGDDKYLSCAENAFNLYISRDLDNFICTAGALDSDCVDKETSYALIISGLMLFELTNNRFYLDNAVKASYYFCSWMYHYNVIYPPECEFSLYNWHTSGGTSVSVTHHHMDPWGAFCAEPFVKLAEYTGDGNWCLRAEIMLSNALQLVTLDNNTVIHSRIRPLGSQNEAYFHCRWFWNKDMPPVPGMINDWLVAWPCAFRISAINSFL